MLKIKPYFPVTVDLDGEKVDLRIQRLVAEEMEEYERYYMRHISPMTVPGASAEEIEAARITAEKEAQAWLRGAMGKYVAIASGSIVVDDGSGQEKPLLSGEDFLKYYGGRLDVCAGVFALIWAENRLSEKQKKSLHAQLASDDGLMRVLSSALAAQRVTTPLPPTEEPGVEPAPTAISADANASATPEAVPASGTPSVGPSSFTTEPERPSVEF